MTKFILCTYNTKHDFVYCKVVVDLAMPGPERLAGEGVLMGAIPIVSSKYVQPC